ncbi:MAG: phytoene dehydrogenase [Desulfobulbus propionicus]|nr:MAG: phytoene dehydrogenase [Desulfobulbus propionicus]
MADYQLIIIGGGLSGIAAGIRAARYGVRTLILEQHSLPGGLNSYYRRQGILYETGLHAMTNHAPVTEKRAPLNLLFRQLKLPRKEFVTREQTGSEIRFPDVRLNFTNDVAVLIDEVNRAFPEEGRRFLRLLECVRTFDPFAPGPWRSTRTFLGEQLNDPLLIDMLLLPVMVYGNAEEKDMDLRQFMIMFRALFLEGLFRPEHTIREFLGQLLDHFKALGGEVRLRKRVDSLTIVGDRITEVVLDDGERLAAAAVISTAGVPETARLTGWKVGDAYVGRMSFVETILLAPATAASVAAEARAIVFFNDQQRFSYCCPTGPVDPSWGVLCRPDQFQGLDLANGLQVRVTLSARHVYWQSLQPVAYHGAKAVWQNRAREIAARHLGIAASSLTCLDCFTPVTIERFTRKAAGAVYGSAVKVRDGKTPWANLFLAGTDQGYLGIVGSMLSGVAMVNRHILS